MCKFPGKILMLAVMALLLSVSVASAQGASSDWNNNWTFLGVGEKANLLNQALAIELVEEDGFDVDYSTNCNGGGACLWGTSLAIGNQQIIDIVGNDNEVEDNELENEGNVSSQVNNGSGEIEQEIED